VNDAKHKVKSLIRETLNLHDKELTILINEYIKKSKKRKELRSSYENLKLNI